MQKECQPNDTKHYIHSFGLDRVKVTEPYSMNAFNKEVDYLLSLDPDRLLAGFYEMQGKVPKAKRYPGWESSEIQGHTLGHYLVALSQAYQSEGAAPIGQRMEYIIHELKLCQLPDGFLFASEAELFDRVENRKPAWVPWYTMHKILSGVVAAYQATNNPEAIEIAGDLGDWIYHRTSKWSKELQELVLSVEYGGMNDVLYDLYQLTGDSKHLEAAHSFDELPLFEAMQNNQDILDGKHANTTIPKLLGAINRYMILGKGEEFYLKAAENFWEMVVNHHSYITGGNSEWEHFGTPDILDAERTNCNCETCNSYNMLKLTKRLFQVTGKRKYTDFYERTQLNAILGSQNPMTGMTTYFQPMDTGYFKVFGTPFDKFWCCVGTGMENFTKLNDGIYYYENDKLFVNRFISSDLNWNEKGVQICQTSYIPDTDRIVFEIHRAPVETKPEFTFAFRIPDWVAGDMIVRLNEETVGYERSDEYIFLRREWQEGDRVELILPLKVRCHSLPDNPRSIAFTYGPVVLCAGLGNQEMDITQTGVIVDIPVKNMEIKDYIIVNKGCVHEWLLNLDEHLVKREGRLEFELKGTDEDRNLVFAPYYRQYSERYGIYWEFFEADSEELRASLNRNDLS